jgi:hypothetical protein
MLTFDEFGWSVFIAITGLFPDRAYLLFGGIAVPFFIRQILDDTFPAEVLCGNEAESRKLPA